MIADIASNKKLRPIFSKLLLRRSKLNVSVFFICKLISKCLKLNSTYYFTIEILNKRELQQIGLNHLSYIDFKDS